MAKIGMQRRLFYYSYAQTIANVSSITMHRGIRKSPSTTTITITFSGMWEMCEFTGNIEILPNQAAAPQPKPTVSITIVVTITSGTSKIQNPLLEDLRSHTSN